MPFLIVVLLHLQPTTLELYQHPSVVCPLDPTGLYQDREVH